MNFAEIVIFPSKGAVLLPVILYIDGTWLSKGGGHNAIPMSCTIGNLPRHVMNKSSAKRVNVAIVFLKFLMKFEVNCDGRWLRTFRSSRPVRKTAAKSGLRKHLASATMRCCVICC